MKSVTTSIRFKPTLREELQTFAAEIGHGMNWVIEQAVIEYMQSHHKALRVKQALKDIAFLQQTPDDQDFWEAAYDDADWKN